MHCCRIPLAVVCLVAVFCLPATRADDKKDKDKPKLEPNEQEKTVLELTNKEREKEKLPPLKLNTTLFGVARAHSANMAKQRKMDHKLDGKQAHERVEAAGYNYAGMGENLSVTTNLTPAGILKGWMGSDIHRGNILSKEFTEIGIGVVKNAQGEVYYTQVFANPLKP